jgi:hypothetical protein
MKIDFATSVQKKLIALDQVTVLRLMAQKHGIAHFPESGETVVSPLLRLRDWDEWWMQAHWTPLYGLGVGAFINSGGGELQMMGMQAASTSEFETRFEEALANPEWVSRHAERARREMLAEVGFAEFCMEIAWEKALKIPATHPARRWRATSIYRLSHEA